MPRRDPDLGAVFDARTDMKLFVEQHMSPEIIWILNPDYDKAFDDLMADEPATKDET